MIQTSFESLIGDPIGNEWYRTDSPLLGYTKFFDGKDHTRQLTIRFYKDLLGVPYSLFSLTEEDETEYILGSGPRSGIDNMDKNSFAEVHHYPDLNEWSESISDANKFFGEDASAVSDVFLDISPHECRVLRLPDFVGMSRPMTHNEIDLTYVDIMSHLDSMPFTSERLKLGFMLGRIYQTAREGLPFKQMEYRHRMS